MMDYGKIYCKGKNVNLNASQSYYEGGGRTLADLLDLVYPIGSIYMNTNNVNPQSIFGGIWQKIEGRFLLGSSSSYTLGLLGGEATHTLTTSEMPKHNHGIERNGNYKNGFMVDTGNSAQWGCQITNVSSGYTAQPKDISVDLVGGSQPHNNMPPYLVVNIWKRTA